MAREKESTRSKQYARAEQQKPVGEQRRDRSKLACKREKALEAKSSELTAAREAAKASAAQ
eukprot:5829472-Pleurochrysis_carterae.AAC.1